MAADNHTVALDPRVRPGGIEWEWDTRTPPLSSSVSPDMIGGNKGDDMDKAALTAKAEKLQAIIDAALLFFIRARPAVSNGKSSINLNGISRSSMTTVAPFFK